MKSHTTIVQNIECATRSSIGWYMLFLLTIILMTAPQSIAQDLEVEGLPEFDIWIPLDKDRINRIYVLTSFASEPNYRYEESVFGASWDKRFHPNWSFRIGAR